MTDIQLQQLRRRYELQAQAINAQYDVAERKRRWETARGNQILCQEKLMNFESFSLSGILARLKGTREQRLEQLRRELRDADAGVQATLREMEKEKEKQKKILQDLDQLPPEEAIRFWIGEDRAGKAEFFRLEVDLCTKALMPLLEENRAAMEETHGYLRGERSGEILSFRQQQDIFAGPDEWAKQCAAWLRRLKAAADELEIPFEIPVYYQNPTAYIATAATQFQRIDRAAKALDQIRAMQKEIQSLAGRL